MTTLQAYNKILEDTNTMLNKKDGFSTTAELNRCSILINSIIKSVRCLNATYMTNDMVDTLSNKIEELSVYMQLNTIKILKNKIES